MVNLNRIKKIKSVRVLKKIRDTRFNWYSICMAYRKDEPVHLYKDGLIIGLFPSVDSTYEHLEKMFGSDLPNVLPSPACLKEHYQDEATLNFYVRIKRPMEKRSHRNLILNQPLAKPMELPIHVMETAIS